MKRLLVSLGVLGIISCAGKFVEEGYLQNESLVKGLFQELKGDYSGSINTFRSSGDKYWGNLLTADVYLYRFRDYAKAKEFVDKVKVKEKSPAAQEVLYRKALLLELLGNYAEAGKLYEFLAVNFPNGKYFEDASQAVEEMFRRNFPDTVAVFDGGYITSMMVDYAIEQIPPFNRNQFDTPEGRKQIAERLAIEVVALKEAEKLKLDTAQKVKEKIEIDRINALRQAYYQYAIKAKATATEKELLAYYNEHKSEYRVPARVELSRVILKDSAKAYEVYNLVKSGQKIDSLAKELSVDKYEGQRGGKITIYDTYEAYKDLFNEAYQKDTGSVFVYKKDTLWMVIRVDEKEADRIRSFDEVKTIVKGAVEGQKEKDLFEKEKQRLREFYGVNIFIKPDTAEKSKFEEERGYEEEAGVLTEEEKNALEKLPDTMAIITKLNRVITKEDFIDRLNKMPRRYRSYYLTNKGAYQLLNDVMIQEILETSEAEFRRYYLHYPIFKRLWESYRDAMLLQLYDVLVKNNVSVSDEEVKEYYEKNRDKEFKDPARIRVQRIVVPTKDSALKVLRRVRGIKNDKQLREFVQKVSIYTGEASAGGFAFITEDREPDFFKEAWKKPLKMWYIGKLNDGNWAVYRVFEKTKESVKPFEDVEAYIKDRLRYEKEKKLYESVLEDLKKKYNILVFEEKFKKAEGEEKGEK
ncbi:MAG: peptidyl-prolyl cis-trans isomerase [candidate division WOR-3 bacterium]